MVHGPNPASNLGLKNFGQLGHQKLLKKMVEEINCCSPRQRIGGLGRSSIYYSRWTRRGWRTREEVMSATLAAAPNLLNSLINVDFSKLVSVISELSENTKLQV